MRYVYVLDQEGRPLMPTSRFRKVRRMLKAGQARAVSTLPFTIQLTYRPKTQERQAVVAGIDPGRTNIGLAAVREDGTCLYQAHGTPRNKEIVNLMSDRLASRRASRRGERLARKRLAKRLHTTAHDYVQGDGRYAERRTDGDKYRNRKKNAQRWAVVLRENSRIYRTIT